MSDEIFHIELQDYSIHQLNEIFNKKVEVQLGELTKEKVQICRSYLDNKMENSDELIYGINTGFGSLCDTAVSKNELSKLQVNLVRSHACGTGEKVPTEIVKWMLLLKALGLSKGHSGVQLSTIERLLFFYNNEIYPVVYQQGSLGASGDLAPLAHIALALLGEGEVVFEGKTYPTEQIYQRFNLKPIALQSKEGLALLNGTQFMSAYLVHHVLKARQLSKNINRIAALSLDAFDGRINPFFENVNAVRKQLGQIEVAAEMRELLMDSELVKQSKKHVQDPYCLRCIPQVHGATRDAISYAEDIVTREINAVTDNPTVFPEEDLVISAGNFHGQPLALALDFLAIAVAELGSISERRCYKMLGGTRGLPAFLVANPGLNSGFMIAQYTAASIVSQNKQLCHPASVDTIDSSNGQEDHVSMGANAATKLARVVENVYQIAGIELMTAAQAIEFRDKEKTSSNLKELVSQYRQIVPFIKEDCYMSGYMRKSKLFVLNLK